MAEPGRLHQTFRVQLDRLRQTALTLVLAQDAAQTPEFVSGAVPLVLDAQRAAVAATDAYMSLEAGLATNSDIDPLGIDAERLIGARARRGVMLEDIYARNHRAAVSTFAERMAREVNTDITLAQRATAWLHTEGDPRVIGWRRVISGTACTLCSIAATQRYRSSDLQPIHDHCSCTVAPIHGDGDAPNPQVIEPLYARLDSAGTSVRRIATEDAAIDIVDADLGPTLIAA